MTVSAAVQIVGILLVFTLLLAQADPVFGSFFAFLKVDLEVVKHCLARLALPYLISRRPDWDKFPGAVDSIGADVVMPSGRTLQCATVHYYGENFARETLRLMPGFIDDVTRLEAVLRERYAEGKS